MPCPVLGKALVHTIGEPEEGKLPKRVQVAGPEEVGESGIDSLGGIDVAPSEPIPKCRRGQVDELELVCAAHDLVGDRLALLDARDLLDDIVQRLEVLNVQRSDDRDAL